MYAQDTAQPNVLCKCGKIKLMTQRDLEQIIRRSHLHARNMFDQPREKQKDGER